LPERTSSQAAAKSEVLLFPQPALQLIYDTAPIGLACLSPHCRYLQINQHLTEICGISVEDHLGRTVRECVPALADSVEAIVRSIMATGEAVTGIEVAGQRTDQGEDRAWITYWHPLEGPVGEIVGINVAAEEITERKRVEAALQASERQFRTLADSIPQLVWMAEADGHIFWFNRHWYDYTGAALAGDHDWQSFLAPDAEWDARYYWAQALEAGTALEVELPLLGSNGQSGPFLTRIIPLRDAAGSVYRWIGTHINISEQRRREEHIRFITDELAHRTKNLLAVVIAIANQTAQHVGDVKQYQTRLLQRFRALAHCHDLLVKDNWHGASFCDLVSAQMRPFGETNANRIGASGPHTSFSNRMRCSIWVWRCTNWQPMHRSMARFRDRKAWCRSGGRLMKRADFALIGARPAGRPSPCRCVGVSGMS
jgi:PAS domain S-box-containing protein